MQLRLRMGSQVSGRKSWKDMGKAKTAGKNHWLRNAGAAIQPTDGATEKCRITCKAGANEQNNDAGKDAGRYF